MHVNFMSLIVNVELKLKVLEEHIGEGEDDAQTPEASDHHRLLSEYVHLRLDVA